MLPPPPKTRAAPNRLPRSPGMPVAWFVLGLGLAATTLAWYVATQVATQRATAAFGYQTQHIRAAILASLRDHELVLRGGAGLFAASDKVTRSEWRAYVNHQLWISRQSREMLGIGFAERVPAAQKDAFERRIGAQYAAQFRIRPEGDRPEYFPVVFLEPYQNRFKLIEGFDQFSEPIRGAAMAQARDTGDFAMSGKTPLFQEAVPTEGFLAFLPVYEKGPSPQSVTERRRALRGYVYTMFRAKDLMNGFTDDTSRIIGISVFQGGIVQPQSRIFVSEHPATPPGYEPAFISRDKIDFGGQTWALEFSSLPAFDAMARGSEPYFLAGSGTLISILLFALLRALIRTKEDAVTLARRMTHDLRGAMSQSAESAERVQAVLDNTLEAIITINEKGMIESFNRSAERIFGYSQDEALGQNISLIMAEPYRSQHDRYIANYLNTGHAKIIGIGREVTGQRKDGAIFPVQLGVSELWVGGKRLFIGIVSDITERKRAENALLEERQQLEIRVRERTESLTRANLALQEEIEERHRIEAQLVATREEALQAARAKADFLANMSHEIRTPMNAVIGMTGLLLDTPLTPEQREYVNTVRVSGDALLTVINDILDFSKIESGHLELEEQPCELSMCIEETFDLLAYQALQKNLDLLYLIEEGVPAYIIGDETRLRQILLNLVSNAIKFTEQGEVYVTITLVSEENDRLVLRIAVRDTGIGIPADRLDRLFKAFSQGDTSTTRKYGGTGLGLVISARLAEMMGGTVSVTSEPGKGSIFYLTITTRRAASPNSGAFLPNAHPELAGKRILVVDDNPTNLLILERQGERWGLAVIAEQSGGAALRRLQQGERFDLAILDLHMPEIDGYELGARIRNLLPKADMPLLLLSSSIASTDHNPPSLLFSGILAKPIKQSQLLDALLNLLAHQERHHAAAPPAWSPDPSFATRTPLRILVAEDSSVNQKLALAILKKMGYIADVAANGLEVLDALRQRHYDLIFMDVQMPEMDGIEATRHIIAQWPPADRPVVVAMTANAMLGDREKCLAAGMDDYISKPVLPAEIQRVLERWSGRKPKNSRTMALDSAGGLLDSRRLSSLSALDEPGKPSLAQNLIRDYLDQSPGTLQAIRSLCQEGDVKAVAQWAHKLKGASLTLGAAQVARVCERIEQEAMAGRGNGLEPLIAELAKIYDQTASEFHKVFPYQS